MQYTYFVHTGLHVRKPMLLSDRDILMLKVFSAMLPPGGILKALMAMSRSQIKTVVLNSRSPQHTAGFREAWVVQFRPTFA